jgi:hypothetical protein
MATIGRWYPRRLVSPAKIAGVPTGATMDGGPLWIPELKRYVCVWYTLNATWIRYLGESSNLFSSSGMTWTAKAGSFYYGGYIYIVCEQSDYPYYGYIKKVSVSTWVATTVATYALTSTTTGKIVNLFFDGTSTIFTVSSFYVSGVGSFLIKKTDITTVSWVDLYTYAYWYQPLAIYGVDSTYLYFLWVDHVYRIAIAGGSPSLTTWKMFGRPGYHTQGGNVLFNKTESLSWDLGRVPSSLVVLEEATPLFIFLSGTTIYFYEGTTLKHSIASGTAFKSNVRDSCMRSDEAKETQGIGLITYVSGVGVELAPMGRESI